MYHTRMDILDTIRDAADRIAQHSKDINERDQAMLEARRNGYPWKTIADAAGLSVQATMTAARRINGGKSPQPKVSELKPGARIY